ncbi:MAG TPA: cyclic nucleotide-binding domain-containing protein [Terriglobales bacterium]|nr:cyclic nucleotide-binding domain-containing protein [Terriglobales bacterium]
MEPPNKGLPFLTANDWALLRDKAHERQFNKDQRLIHEGLAGNTLFLIESGKARVERRNGAQTIRIATLGAGDICGEMSFIEKGSASASVVADEELRALALDSTTLQAVFESFPHVGSRFFRSVALVLSRRLRATSAELAKSRAGGQSPTSAK